MDNQALAATTLCGAFQSTTAQRAGAVAHRASDGGSEFTFGEYAARVCALAEGLHALGVRRGDTVGLMLLNRPVFALADVAAMHLGAVAFSIYNTLSTEQVGYVLGNAGPRVVIAERSFLPAILAARNAELEHVVVVDGPADGALSIDDVARQRAPGFRFEDAWRAVEPDDVVTLIYTSGTTGPPKAVQLTHRSVLAAARGYLEALPRAPGGSAISYLPAAHIAERVGVHYMTSLCVGATITSVADQRQLGATLPAVRPTIFGGVPRVWEKLRAALEVAGCRDPGQLPEAARAALRARIGLDQVDHGLSGAAPAAMDTLGYFAALGLPVIEGWGMSETSFLATVSPPREARMGTVGRAIPGVELRIDADGEVLVRGPLVMRGYRNDPQKTAEAIDAEGWLRTGDIGRIDGDGYLAIVDRKKEIIINSAGKNMSPANIERELRSSSPLIAHAVCIGDRRPYNVALLALDREVLARAAPSAEALRATIDAAVAAANSRLSRVEQIKRYAIVDGEWLPGGDELTPTMKLKRKPIHAKYAAEIERLYS